MGGHDHPTTGQPCSLGRFGSTLCYTAIYSMEMFGIFLYDFKYTRVPVYCVALIILPVFLSVRSTTDIKSAKAPGLNEQV